MNSLVLTPNSVASTPRNASPGQLLRLAFVITRSDSIGGASIHVRDLARLLISIGHEVTVFIGNEGPVTDVLRSAGVPYVSLKYLTRAVDPSKDWRGFWELRRALQRYKPDLISTHTSKAGVLGRICAWSLAIPAIYTPHCWSFADGFPGARLYLWAERLARPFGKKIIMVSESERADGLKGRIAGPEHLQTVHNGMPDIAPQLRADPGQTSVRITMVGRCEVQKDHHTLLHALAEVKNLSWTLDCIGDGPLREKLESLVRELGLSGRVQFLGYRKDVTEQLSRSQIFVLITNWEGFPRSILEAMRAGLPVIASDVGGNAESVADGSTGFIVKRADVAGLAGKLRALITDPNRRVSFGASGRLRYEREFTLERMVQKTLSVWESVLGRPIRMRSESAKITAPKNPPVMSPTKKRSKVLAGFGQ